MSDAQPAMAYPTSDQYDRWKARADEFDMSVSEFMQSMVEAGMKKFDGSVEPDETNHELREQRNDLKDELDRTRSRVEELEEQLHGGERAAVREFVAENPGAEFGEIVQQVIDTAPERVNRHLDDLESDALRVENGEYYPMDDTGGVV
jgi:predicted nuclease with TOPRIM domain